MHAERHPVRFGVGFLVWSAVLGWVFSSTRVVVGTYSPSMSMLAVPCVGAMLAAVGFGWRRKIAYACTSLALYVLSTIVADVAGLGALASRQLNSPTSFPSVSVLLFMAYLSTFPFAMLILFVGRRPSLLWSTERS